MGNGANYTRAIFHHVSPYTLTFEANSGSGSMNTLTFTGSTTLPSNTFTRAGYAFAGWNTASDGGGSDYVDAAEGVAADLTLYAQWSAVAITFDANGGVGSMPSQVEHASSTLDSNSYTKSGYRFTGWNTLANAAGTEYADAGSYGFSADVTLYAQWALIPAPAAAAAAATAVEATPLPSPVPAAVVVPRAIPLAAIQKSAQRTAPQAMVRLVESGVEAPATALIDGKEVSVLAQSVDSRNARFAVGKLSLDIGFSETGGSVDTVGGTPSLKIARGQAAAVKGGGLKPQSVLQVFMPSLDGSFIELPSVTVGADGSFVGELTMGATGRGKPMPIGKRFLQMVGVDEDGNDTVLDIPISVAQPLPAPELNRLSGDRPLAVPGALSALNGGTPETVELTTAPGVAIMDGEGWSFGVVSSSNGEQTSALALTRDAPVTFSGEGFMPGTRADVWLFSDPTLLGTVDIADDGTFSADFAVDSNFVPTGNHTLQIQGVGDDGYVRAASLGVVVDDPIEAPVLPVSGGPISWMPVALVATSLGGLMLLVGLTLAIRRRSRPVVPTAPVW